MTDVDRQRTRLPKNGRRRRVHNDTYTVLPRGYQDIDGPDDIRQSIGNRLLNSSPITNRGRKMKDCIHAGCGSRDDLLVTNIADQDLDIGWHVLAITGAEVIQDGDFVALKAKE